MDVVDQRGRMDVVDQREGVGRVRLHGRVTQSRSGAGV